MTVDPELNARRNAAGGHHHPECSCTRCDPLDGPARPEPTRGARAFGAFVGLCAAVLVALSTVWLCVLLVSAIGRAW